MLLLLVIAVLSLGSAAGSVDELFGVKMLPSDDNDDGGMSPKAVDIDHEFELIMYKKDACEGKKYKLTDSNAKLGDLSGKWTRFKSFTLYGTWIMYQQSNFGVKDPSRHYFGIETPPRCFKQPLDRVRSVRKVGSNSKDQAMYVWPERYFGGPDTYVARDGNGLINLDKGAKSVIVTGVKGFSIYNGVNYGGKACCIYPQDLRFYWPFITVDTMEYYIPHDWIKSAVEGCDQAFINCFYFDANGYPWGVNNTAIGRK